MGTPRRGPSTCQGVARPGWSQLGSRGGTGGTALPAPCWLGARRRGQRSRAPWHGTAQLSPGRVQRHPLELRPAAPCEPAPPFSPPGASSGKVPPHAVTAGLCAVPSGQGWCWEGEEGVWELHPPRNCSLACQQPLLCSVGHTSHPRHWHGPEHCSWTTSNTRCALSPSPALKNHTQELGFATESSTRQSHSPAAPRSSSPASTQLVQPRLERITTPTSLLQTIWDSSETTMSRLPPSRTACRDPCASTWLCWPQISCWGSGSSTHTWVQRKHPPGRECSQEVHAASGTRIAHPAPLSPDPQLPGARCPPKKLHL